MSTCVSHHSEKDGCTKNDGEMLQERMSHFIPCSPASVLPITEAVESRASRVSRARGVIANPRCYRGHAVVAFY
jgi:hypothetical protein